MKIGIALLDQTRGRNMAKRACEARGVTIEQLENLVRLELRLTGAGRRAGLWIEMEDILNDILPEQESLKP